MSSFMFSTGGPPAPSPLCCRLFDTTHPVFVFYVSRDEADKWRGERRLKPPAPKWIKLPSLCRGFHMLCRLHRSRAYIHYHLPETCHNPPHPSLLSRADCA